MKLILAFAIPLAAQVASEANASYKNPENRQRMIGTLDGSHRDARQKPKELVAALRITKMMAVADIGVGPGYMLPHFAEAAGTVYAEDIFPDFLARAKQKAGGRLAIVDYYKRRNAMSNSSNPDFAITHIRLDDKDVIKEVEANGFKLVEHREFLAGSQYLVVFEKK